MKKRRLIFISVAALLAIFVLFTLSRKTIAPVPPAAAVITPPPLHPSAFPKPLNDIPIAYAGSPQATFPKMVPYYEIFRRRSFDGERSRLLTLFGTSGKQAAVVGSKGRYEYFSWENKNGILSESPLAFSYTSSAQSGRTVSNDINKYKKIVVSLLADHTMLPSPFVISEVKQTFFSFQGPHPTELSGPQGALVTQLDFSVALQSLPLFINNADSFVFSASFNGDDDPIVFRGRFLPTVSETALSIAIISYEEALSRLINNEGILSSLSLTSQKEQEFMTGEIPTSIAIESVELGYYYSDSQNYLIPVFVFTGSAQEPGTGATLRTKVLVSAI